MSGDRRMMIGAGKGLVAGVVGVAVMTLGEKVEQAFPHRANSVVPAHTLERLLGRPAKPDGHGAVPTWRCPGVRASPWGAARCDGWGAAWAVGVSHVHGGTADR